MTLIKELRYNLHWIVIASIAGICLGEIIDPRTGFYATLLITLVIMPLVEGTERLNEYKEPIP